MIRELEEKVGREIKLTEDCLNALASTGTDIKYGAREIKRVINKQIKSNLAEVIISGDLKKNSTIYVDFDNKSYTYNVSIK